MSNSPAGTPSRSLRAVAILVLVIASTTVGLVVAEAGLRMFRPQIFPVHPPGMYTEDSLAGRGLTPNFSGRLQRADFDTPFTVNSAGFRGPELRPRQANTVRIVSLGDSQTFGFGVGDDETYPVQLERLLSELFPGRDIQVVNTGVPGYGTYDQLQLLRSRWEELEPDLVLLQFLPVNDFQENRDAVRRLQPQVRDGMLTSASDPSVESRQPAWVRAMGWTKRRLHVARLVSESAGYIAMRMGAAQKVDALWGEDFTADDAMLTQTLLEEVASTARAGGAGMLFLYSTAKPAMMRAEYTVPRSRSVIEKAAACTGTNWIDLNESMRERDRPHRFYFVRDGHWSPAGHRVIAEILATQLQTLSLLSAPPVTDRASPGIPQTLCHADTTRRPRDCACGPSSA